MHQCGAANEFSGMMNYLGAFELNNVIARLLRCSLSQVNEGSIL